MLKNKGFSGVVDDKLGHPKIFEVYAFRAKANVHFLGQGIASHSQSF